MRTPIAVMCSALLGCGSPAGGIDATIDTAADAPSIPGLIAYYPMDDDPGDGELDDATGNGRPARCVAGLSCPIAAAGRVGDSSQFDGTNHLTRVTYAPSFDTPAALTVAAWVFYDVGGTNRIAVAKPYGPASADSWALVAFTTSTCFETTVAAGGQSACSAVLPTGRWIHLAGRWDGIDKSLFVDGQRVAQFVASDPLVFDIHDVLIGGDENGGGSTGLWPGRIDDVRIYDRALLDAEIATLAGM